MKHLLRLTLVLLASTALGVGSRHAMSGSSEASRAEPRDERLDRTAGPDRPRFVEGAGLSPASDAGEKSDAEYARAAAATGDRLLDRARLAPDATHLLRQAAAHYRAALSHEPTARNAGDLFASVRDKLAAIDRMSRPGVAKPMPRPSLPPAVAKAPPSAPAAPPVSRRETPGRLMVGPDGVEIRRAGRP